MSKRADCARFSGFSLYQNDLLYHFSFKRHPTYSNIAIRYLPPQKTINVFIVYVKNIIDIVMNFSNLSGNIRALTNTFTKNIHLMLYFSVEVKQCNCDQGFSLEKLISSLMLISGTGLAYPFQKFKIKLRKGSIKTFHITI